MNLPYDDFIDDKFNTKWIYHDGFTDISVKRNVIMKNRPMEKR